MPSERWLREALAWMEANQSLLAWSAVGSVLMFLGSLAVMPILLARMRADYFLRPGVSQDTWFGRHPVARVVARLTRNAVGAVLLVAGLAMMVLPGQGVITLLVALSLLEFPGKRQLELTLVRQPRVEAAINWVRQQAGRPPLLLPPRDEDEATS